MNLLLDYYQDFLEFIAMNKNKQLNKLNKKIN